MHVVMMDIIRVICFNYKRFSLLPDWHCECLGGPTFLTFLMAQNCQLEFLQTFWSENELYVQVISSNIKALQ